MPVIKANTGIVTQINTFTVAPENRQPLIDLLIEAANAVRYVPGWISASIHRGLEGTRVVNYAQCESMEAWERIMAKLKSGRFPERSQRLATAHPGLYEAVYTLKNLRRWPLSMSEPSIANQRMKGLG